MFPKYLVRPRVGVHKAVEVDVVVFLDIFWVQVGAQGEPQDRNVCNRRLRVVRNDAVNSGVLAAKTVSNLS